MMLKMTDVVFVMSDVLHVDSFLSTDSSSVYANGHVFGMKSAYQI